MTWRGSSAGPWPVVYDSDVSDEEEPIAAPTVATSRFASKSGFLEDSRRASGVGGGSDGGGSPAAGVAGPARYCPPHHRHAF
jgi:hypothetical protein